MYELRVFAAVAAHSPDLLSSLPVFVEKDVRSYLTQRDQGPLFHVTFVHTVSFEPTMVLVGSTEYAAYVLTLHVTTTGFLDGKEELSRAIPVRPQRRENELYTIVQATVNEL